MGAGGLLLWSQSVAISKKGKTSEHFIQDQLNITPILFSDVFVFLWNPGGGGLELEWLIGAKSAWQARRTHLRFTADLIPDADEEEEYEDNDGGGGEYVYDDNEI